MMNDLLDRDGDHDGGAAEAVEASRCGWDFPFSLAVVARSCV